MAQNLQYVRWIVVLGARCSIDMKITIGILTLSSPSLKTMEAEESELPGHGQCQFYPDVWLEFTTRASCPSLSARLDYSNHL